MDQKPLFISDVYDALGDAVRALGGPKRVGGLMRPELPADQAGRWVSDCLNREHRSRFDPEQMLLLLRLAREAGAHGAFGFLAQSCGYAEPVPVEPEEIEARARREFTEAVERLRVIGESLRMWDKLPSPLRVAR